MHVPLVNHLTVPSALRQRGRYLLAALLTAAALWLRGTLDPLLGDSSPHLITFIPVVFASLAWGLGAGITATLTSILLVELAYRPPAGTPPIQAALTTLLYALVCLAVSVMGGQRKAALVLTERQAQELEAQIQARTRTLEARTAALDEARIRNEVMAHLNGALLKARCAEDVSLLAVQPLGPFMRAHAMLVIHVRDDELYMPHVWGEPPEYMAQYFHPARRPLTQAPLLRRLVESRKPAYLTDYRAFPDATIEAPQLACGVEPIVQPDGHLEGFLVCWRAPGPWSVVERDLLQRAAATIGLALERAQVSRQADEANQRLQQSSVRLAEVHAELAAYATSLSHDLIEPVRRVRGFAALLERRFRAAGDEKTVRYFEILRQEVERVHGLAEDLAHFAHSEPKPPSLQDVSLSLLVAQVRTDLVLLQQGRKVRWEVGELPTVRADAQMLRMVLTNLLHNALKFTRSREETVIRVTAETTTQGLLVRVADNGTGFNPLHADRLFQVFGRLHPEVEGAGVGLANVRRVVTLHGGEVSAAGQPGQGAVFSFSLPSHPEGAVNSEVHAALQPAQP